MPQGGKRQNAGRPTGTGHYGEKTIPIRIPQSLLPTVRQFIVNKGFALPLYSCKVQAGFPSPADDYQEGSLDLNEHLIKHPAATFFVRAIGVSMINAGIGEGDLLIVDRSLKATTGKIVIAVINGEFTVKRLKISGKKIQLIPENKDFSPIDITDETELTIWGVVTNIIRSI